MTSSSPTTLFKRIRIPLLIYLIALSGYLGASSTRLKQATQDNHYAYLARDLLAGRLSLQGRPPHGNDWSLVHELTLRDGRSVRGTYLKTGGENLFKTTHGERLVIEPSQIRARKQIYYVSFPWFPALLMLPFVALWGIKTNDVLFNVLLAPANVVLVYLLLRRLSARGYSHRSLSDDLWLTGLFAFGTVYFYASVVGQVWYTAHVVGVGLTALYALAALEGRHPFVAGLCLGLGFITRTPIPFSFPLIVGELLRRHLGPAPGSALTDSASSWWQRARQLYARVHKAPMVRALVWAGIPALFIASIAFTVNYLRFDSPFEFGHYYLNVRWTERIQRWGLFNYHFLSRNLAAMFCLLPRILTRAPYLKISHHGLSLFFTTPPFAYLIWPKRKSALQTSLYLSCLIPMILHLLYQNSGWQQFGYRFSLDYTVYLIALWALSGHRLGWFAKALFIFSGAVNTFGAATYARAYRFYSNGSMFWVE